MRDLALGKSPMTRKNRMAREDAADIFHRVYAVRELSRPKNS